MASPPDLLSPKPSFLYVPGKVTQAKIIYGPTPDRAFKPVLRAGQLYENKAREQLRSLFPDMHFNTWWSYRSEGSEPRRCQTDGVWSDLGRGQILIVEIKKQHTSDSWWQLRKLYEPVVKAWRPGNRIRLVTMVRSFDPFVRYPEELVYIEDFEGWMASPHDYMGVYSWRP